MWRSVWQMVIKYGITGGALVVALLLILYFTRNNPLVNARYSDIIVQLVFVLFGIKEFRDVKNHRVLHFWQGMSVGCAISLTIALVSAVSILILTSADQGLLPDYIRQNIEFVQENRDVLVETIDENAYEDTLANLQRTSVTDLVLDDFLKKSIIGLFLAIIISIILRKKPL
jgi:hypothetical protein